MLRCVPLKIQMLTDLFKEDLLQYLENVNGSQLQDATARRCGCLGTLCQTHQGSATISCPAWNPHLRGLNPQKPSAGFSSLRSPRAKHVCPRIPSLHLYFIPQKKILKLTFIVLERILLVSLRAIKENGIFYERRRKPGSFFPF